MEFLFTIDTIAQCSLAFTGFLTCLLATRIWALYTSVDRFDNLGEKNAGANTQ